MNRVLITYSFLAVLILGGCGPEEVIYDVPPEFQIYVDRFIEIAAQEGQVIDFSDTGLSIQFRNAVDQETGGVCKGNHEIEIEKFFWDGLSEFDKEGLIFHELGHCELFRVHRNDKLVNGEWASRMRGSPIPEGDNAVINYAGTRLDYYRREFFDTNLSPPAWANISATFNDPFSRQPIDVITDVMEFDNAYISLSDGDFEIEVIMTTGTSEGFVGVQFMGAGNDDRIRIAYNRDSDFVIDSGNDVWGTMYFDEDSDLVQGGENKLTIRRQGEYYFVFMNETFVYWFDYIIPRRESVASLNAGALGQPDYVSVSINTLN